MLVNVQALRAVAALIVLCIHLPAIFAAAGTPQPLGGVDLFFVISGFIMVHATRADDTAGRFLLRRAIRIVPLYWAFTLLTFVLALGSPSLFQNTEATLPALAGSLAFIPYEQPGTGLARPLLFLGWTLNYEMFFYTLFAAGLLIKPRWVGLSLVALGLVATAAIGAILEPTNIVGRFYTSPVVLEFGFGMAVAAWIGARPKPPLSARWYVVALAAGLAVLCYGHLISTDQAPVLVNGAPAAVIVLAAVRLEQSRHAIRAPVLVAIGAASYSLYLSHIFIARAADKAFVAAGNPAWAPLAAALAIGAAVAVALAIYKWVELPMTRRARRVFLPPPPYAATAPASPGTRQAVPL